MSGGMGGIGLARAGMARRMVRARRGPERRGAPAAWAVGGARVTRVAAVMAMALSAGCAGAAAGSGAPGPAGYFPNAVVVAEVFETIRDPRDNIDSPAVWHGPGGQHWLIATAKDTDVVVVHDAVTGAVLRRFGGPGTEPGRFERPNGVAVVEDILFVVERDNARVQVLSLPDFRPLGTFGEPELRFPYGIATVDEGGGTFRLYITDNYELEEDVVPPDSMLGERVREYRVRIGGRGVASESVRSFGDTTGAGVLRVVESIAADPAHDRLLIAEEQEGVSAIKVYTLAGRFAGRVIDDGLFPYEAEGIALYDCGGGAGYWIATDQSEVENTFHVLDRATLAHLGSFRGRTVRNTDGIALTRRAFGPFAEGAFYAVHDDGNVAAFSWSDIAEALRIPASCGAR